MTAGHWLAAFALLANPAGSPPAIASASAAAPSLDAWHGRWAGEGTAFGKPATATLAIAAADGATRLVYHLDIAGSPAVRYSAEAVYRTDAKGRITARWTDSYGQNRPVSGRIEGGVWASHWGSADTEIGRSIYRFESDDVLIVTDAVLQPDGRWRGFAELRFRRANR